MEQADGGSAIGRSAARVLIAAATRLFRDGVVAALSDDERFLVVGSAGDAREFVWRSVSERPDVALVDVEMLRAAVAQGLLPNGESNAPRLIVLAVADREEEISACANAGATEIVGRHADRAELLATLARAVDGESRLPLLVAALGQQATAVQSPPEPAEAAPAFTLTPREYEILGLIEAGYTNKAIALQLGCSQSTVKNHVHTLLSKLGVSRRTEAARMARELLADREPELSRPT